MGLASLVVETEAVKLARTVDQSDGAPQRSLHVLGLRSHEVGDVVDERNLRDASQRRGPP